MSIDMSISQTINEDIKLAMKAKDKERLNALRAVKSAFLLAATEKGSASELSDDIALKAISKLLKQREDSAALYAGQNRQDLADEELAQAAILKEYLPQALSEQEIAAAVEQIISEIGASGMKDMGKVMAAASKQLAGKADGKDIADCVKKLLA